MDKFAVVTRGQRAQLAEGIIWSEREQAVYWVDIMGPAVHRLEPVTGHTTTWTMPESIGWVVERATQRGFIGGFASGFAEVTLDPHIIRPIGDPEPELAGSRMNDAAVDASGRIWAGTMDNDGSVPVGALYRLDADHRWRKMDAGYLVSNGPTFSPDGRYLYHTDSLRREIYRFELHPDGSVSEKQVWVTFPEEWGVPDGMTTDAEGGVWVAHWGGARVTRFSPQGEFDRTIELPASQVTNCAFGGPDLDRLYVTTAACDRPSETLAGELFEIDPGVRGLAPRYFAG